MSQATPRITATMELADWRAAIGALYARIREAENPRTAWTTWRETRDLLFRDSDQSPIPAMHRASYPGVPVFDYDPAWRFEVALESPLSSDAVSGQIGEDGTISLRPVATTSGLEEILGTELTIYWIEGYGGGLFLPFRDGTAGSETYGGGRYLLDAIKGADLGRTASGRLILDFNFSYHPSCAHAPDWICPLAPEENTFAAPVRAGERL